MIRSLLESPDTYASPVILYLIDRYGFSVIDFEPETVSESLLAVNPNTIRPIIDRVNAGLGLITSDLFWNDPFVFGTVCRSLNRHKFPTAAAPSLYDLAWGVNEVSLLTNDPDTGDKLSVFDDKIKRFIQVTARSEGVTTLPGSLSSITTIDSLIGLDDQEIVAARQAESDQDAAEIDELVNIGTITLFNQIASLKLNLTEDAMAELKDITSSSV